MTEELHLFVSGLVQGVGFRHSLYRQALKLGLRGWVRNLPDGRVEALVQGERSAIEQLLAWSHRGPALARVDRVVATWEAAETAASSFEIVF